MCSYIHNLNFFHNRYVIPPDDSEKFEQLVRELIKNQPQFNQCEQPLRHKDIFLSPKKIIDHGIKITKV